MVLKKIRVVHVVSRFDIGGMENGIVNICNNLDRSRFEPILCCVKGGGAMLSRLRSDVKIVDLHCRDGKDALRFLVLRRYFVDEKPDVVHTHGWGGCSFDAILGARLAGVPVVVNGEHGSFFMKGYQIVLQAFLSVLVDTTLCVSESLRQKISSKLGIPLYRLRVIHNGVNTAVFSGRHDRSAIRRELSQTLGVPVLDKDFVIGSVASLKPLKNQILIIEALKLISNRNYNNNFKVIFVGSGPDYNFLQDMVLRYNLGDSVFFLGNRDDLPRLLSVMSALIVSSKLDSEGLSNSTLEAMASGLPVISTKSVGAREIIDHNINGIILESVNPEELANVILVLREDEKLLKKLGEKARDLILRKFSLESMLLEYGRVYEEFLRKKNKRCHLE